MTIPSMVQSSKAKYWIIVYFLSIGVAVHQATTNHPNTPGWIQTILVTLLAPVMAFLIESILKKLQLGQEKESYRYFTERFTYGSLILCAHAFTMGRIMYLSYMTGDDIGYLGVTGQNINSFARSIIEPVNVHFIPLFRLINNSVYNFWGWDNFGIATTTLFLTSSIFYLFYAILRIWLSGWNPLIPATTAFFAAIWPTYSYNYIWKAGSFWMFLGGFFFFLFILAWLHFERAPSRRGVFLITLFSVSATASCSYFPMPLAFLIPLCLSVPFSTLKKKLIFFRFPIFCSIGISVAYFFVQKFIIAYFHYGSPYWYIDSLKNIWWIFSAYFLFILTQIRTENLLLHAINLVIILIVLPGITIYLDKKYKNTNFQQRLGLLLFSLGIMAYNSLIVCIGRQCHETTVVISRYGIFAAIAVATYLTAIMPTYLFRIEKKYMTGLYTALACFSLFSSLASVLRDANMPAILDVASRRKNLFTHLERAVCAVHHRNLGVAGSFDLKPLIYLPNIPMTDILEIEAMEFSPAFIAEKVGFSLDYYAKGLVSSCYDSFFVRFIPKNLMTQQQIQDAMSLPEVKEFYTTFDTTWKPTELPH